MNPQELVDRAERTISHAEVLSGSQVTVEELAAVAQALATIAIAKDTIQSNTVNNVFIEVPDESRPRQVIKTIGDLVERGIGYSNEQQ